MLNINSLCVYFLLFLSLLRNCNSVDHSAILLANAGQDVAFQPLVNGLQGTRNSSHTPIFEEQAHFDDLATTRLQVRTNDVVDMLWKKINDPQRFAILKEKGAAEEVLKIFARLKNDIDALDSRIKTAKVETTLKTLTLSDYEWRKAWESLQKLTGKVKLLYSYIDGYMSNPNQVSQIGLEDYARSILQPGSSQDTSMPRTLVLLNNVAIPRPDSGNGQPQNDVLSKLWNTLKLKDGLYHCDTGQSVHQLVYNLYNMIALTEVKGYSMIQFSYMMLRIYDKGNYTLESSHARKSFEHMATEKLVAIADILPKMDKNYWRCDPSTPIEGVTFAQLTKLLQGHIENEVDMNEQKTCRHNCAKYDVAEPKNCYKNLQCAKQDGCKIPTSQGLKPGRLFDCQFYHADAWVCMSQDQSRRKYDWIEYEDGKILGKKEQCENKIKVDSWWRWLFFHCSYCLCKCDAPGPTSDRYWSLKPATSNIKKNFIVTGVRFVKKSRVIHIEIEQAKALSEGGIDEASRVWLESRTIKIDDDYGTESGASSEQIGIPTSNSNQKEYFVMNYEKRSLDIDQLQAPASHVITGVRFRNLGGHLNLEARVTPIKFREGKLLPDNSLWISNDNTPASINMRQPFFLLAPDVPTRFKGQSVIDTSTNQYLAFDTTSPEKDVMQTTVPFIDLQNVAPKSGSWLSGVGLYHKGKLGYGGYIGFSVQTFDFSRHMIPDSTADYITQALKYNFDTRTVK